MHLSTQEFYLKMSLNGESQTPFSGRTAVLEIPDGSASFMRECIRLSRANYGMPLAEVPQALMSAEFGRQEREQASAN